MSLQEIALLVVFGALCGAAVFWLWQREARSLRGEGERLAAQVEALNRRLALEQASRAALEARTDAERGQAEEKLKLLAEARQALGEQFQNLANRIFEEKGEKLVQQNVANLESVLKPLGERLKDFQVKVEETYDKESKQRFSLQHEIEKLVEANAKIGADAVNLANALKGSSKTQGAWGELVLERVLEASGLQKGREYDVQVSLERPEGGKAQPDVVVRLPEGKHVVVDSKVSLTAYEASCSSDDEAVRKRELARHVESVRNHVKGLAEKNYQALYGIRTPDFVLMFIPVEPAFMLALSEKQELFAEAFSRNVMIVSPTTLLIALRTIASIWRYEYQNRNAQELVRQCTALYEKFVGFVADVEEVGKRLDAAQKSYDGAYGKLASGKGNLIRQVERIRELGLKPGKPLPLHLTEQALETEADADAEVRPLPAAQEHSVSSK